MDNDWEPWAKIAAAFATGGGAIAVTLRLISRSFSSERVQLARDDGEVHGFSSLKRALAACEQREQRTREDNDRLRESLHVAERRADLAEQRVGDLTREAEGLRKRVFQPPRPGDKL